MRILEHTHRHIHAHGKHQKGAEQSSQLKAETHQSEMWPLSLSIYLFPPFSLAVSL